VNKHKNLQLPNNSPMKTGGGIVTMTTVMMMMIEIIAIMMIMETMTTIIINSYLWTKSGCRLQLIRASEGKNLHWLFLPGGPGLGSEALSPLTSILKLPGTSWHVDLPGDGSNRAGSIKHWKPAFLEAVRAFENVILVGHSRGGMFALATPELQKNLKGLVLLDTAPDNSWQQHFARRIKKHPLPEADKLEKAYRKNPSNASLKAFILAGTPYMFNKASLKKGTESLKNLPYNYKAIQWTQAHFDPTYTAKWIPKIPTLILSGEDDLATPLSLFQKKQYKRSNILQREIKDAGHFPWIENPRGVISAFNDYVLML
jgi:pimeloyl-ACP methyl ester carboxylesterase